VQDDNVTNADLLRGLGEVEDAPFEPAGQCGLGQQSPRFVLVSGGQFEIGGANWGALEQLDWMFPTPLPISSTDAPARPRSAASSTMRRAVLLRPFCDSGPRTGARTDR
jgi:hypothetical protein